MSRYISRLHGEGVYSFFFRVCINPLEFYQVLIVSKIIFFIKESY